MDSRCDSDSNSVSHQTWSRMVFHDFEHQSDKNEANLLFFEKLHSHFAMDFVFGPFNNPEAPFTQGSPLGQVLFAQY